MSDSKKLDDEAVIIHEKAAEHHRAYKERKQANSLLNWRTLRAQRAAERFARPKENVKSSDPELNLVVKGKQGYDFSVFIGTQCFLTPSPPPTPPPKKFF